MISKITPANPEHVSIPEWVTSIAQRRLFDKLFNSIPPIVLDNSAVVVVKKTVESVATPSDTIGRGSADTLDDCCKDAPVTAQGTTNTIVTHAKTVSVLDCPDMDDFDESMMFEEPEFEIWDQQEDEALIKDVVDPEPQLGSSQASSSHDFADGTSSDITASSSTLVPDHIEKGMLCLSRLQLQNLCSKHGTIKTGTKSAMISRIRDKLGIRKR